MQKKTHLAFGLFFFSVFYLLGLPFEYSFLIGIVAFLPDIDWLMDKIWFKENSLAKKIWYRFFKSNSMHRTFLHNVWAMLFFTLVFVYFSHWSLLVIFATIVGYLSHLLLDSMTVSGVYWLWPYGDERIFGKRKLYKNGKFVTGSASEKVIFILLIISGGTFTGLGLYKQNPIPTQDIYHTILYVAVIILVGIVLMKKLVYGLSRATSRIFR